jgi:hypothetical protein
MFRRHPALQKNKGAGRFVLKSQADNLPQESVKRMSYDKRDAIARARKDLAARLGLAESEIKEDSVADADFPNTALGAPVGDEMSGMMLTSGWRIQLKAAGKTYEYRADRNQVRLYKFKGANYKL